jgi:hypothetical protein
MASPTTTKLKLIRCPNCGSLRNVTARHARRNPKTCRACARSEDYRVFWLEIFTDEEICVMVESLCDMPIGMLDRRSVAMVRSSILTVT